MTEPESPSTARRSLKGCLLVAAGLLLLTVTVTVIVGWTLLGHTPVATAPDNPPPALSIEDVTVIDVVSGEQREHMDVLVEGALIKRIAPHKEGVPKGAQSIDGAGLSLIPGLIDGHCHVETASTPAWTFPLPALELNLERLLYSGVTRVFDPGSRVPAIFELRTALREGEAFGPHLHAAGPLFTAVGGHPEPMMRALAPSFVVEGLIAQSTRQIATPEDAGPAIEALAPLEPDFIKVVVDALPMGAPTMEEATAAAIVREAKARDLRAVAHIGTTEDALQAGRIGVTAWIHGVYKERIPDDAIAPLADFGIPMMPTLVVFQSYGEVGRGAFAPTPLEREIVSPETLASYNARPDDYVFDPEMLELLELLTEQEQISIDNVRRLYKAGVTILAGSDSQNNVIHGPALHRELALLTKAGLPPIDVLRAATLHNARFLTGSEDPPFGVVATGKVADLVLIKGDPLKDAAAISNVRAVIKAGVLIERHPIKE